MASVASELEDDADNKVKGQVPLKVLRNCRSSLTVHVGQQLLVDPECRNVSLGERKREAGRIKLQEPNGFLSKAEPLAVLIVKRLWSEQVRLALTLNPERGMSEPCSHTRRPKWLRLDGTSQRQVRVYYCAVRLSAEHMAAGAVWGIAQRHLAIQSVKIV